MKIKTTSSFYVVKKGVFNVGEIVEFENELARQLITQGVAIEYIEEKHPEKEKHIVKHANILAIFFILSPHFYLYTITINTLKSTFLNFNILLKTLKRWLPIFFNLLV